MNKEILVVDDESCIIQVMRVLLPTYHVKPICFEEGCSALDFLENRKTPCLGYLVDMRIPCCLEGSEKLFNYVRDNHLGVENFMFMTGHVSPHDEEVIKRTQADYLLKPISKEEIGAWVDKILENQLIHNYH